MFVIIVFLFRLYSAILAFHPSKDVRFYFARNPVGFGFFVALLGATGLARSRTADIVTILRKDSLNVKAK